MTYQSRATIRPQAWRVWQGGVPALMKLTTTFPLERYDTPASGPRMPPFTSLDSPKLLRLIAPKDALTGGIFGQSQDRSRPVDDLQSGQCEWRLRGHSCRSSNDSKATSAICRSGRHNYSSGHTSTTPCATAHGTCETFWTASARSAASITANPAIGKADDMNGPSRVSRRAASGLRTCTGEPAIPIRAPCERSIASCS